MHPKILCLVLVPSFVWISVTGAACGRPGIPAKGIIKNFKWKESFEEDDSLEYECSDEYGIVPDRPVWLDPSKIYRRTCINGIWSRQLPVCAQEYNTTSMSVCRMSGRTTKCHDMPDCLTLDKQQAFWKIHLDKQYHVSDVIFLQRPRCIAGDDRVFNISVSSNSTTRYLIMKLDYSRLSCQYCFHMEDNSSPLANTINIAVNWPFKNEIKLCAIHFFGIEFTAGIDCGQPDSPLYSVVTYSNDNRTAFFKCKSGYQAVGDTSRTETLGNRDVWVSRCTDDLRWTKLDMKCIHSNDLPPVETQKDVNDIQLSFILAVTPLGLFLCIISTILGKILYRRWQKQREQQDLIEELQRMENRRVALNPDVPLDEQSDLISYNQRWEFPKERLKLGKCLGEGAFGTVVKAEATGINAGEWRTTVAVKMVKYQGNKELLKALLIELKILSYVGHHINIVNLLGAVTKNLAKGELMVITEYCEFGNLRNFLLCQRDRFINQIDPETGDLTTETDAVPSLPADEDEKDYQHPAPRDVSKKFVHGQEYFV